MTAAAFKATFSDFRLVRGRKVATLMFEVPIEGADAALAALGGLPRPDAETWVAVARLVQKAVSEPPKERRKWDELSLPEQAALRCQDRNFREFLRRMSPAIRDSNDAAQFVRDHCGIGSRAELSVSDIGARKWRELDSGFCAWKLTPLSAG